LQVVSRDKGCDYEDGTWGTDSLFQTSDVSSISQMLLSLRTRFHGSMVPWAIAEDTMQFQDDELSYALGKQVMGTSLEGDALLTLRSLVFADSCRDFRDFPAGTHEM